MKGVVMDSPYGKVNKLVIKKFWLFETYRAQGDIYRRSFEVDGSMGAIDKLGELMASADVKNYNKLSPGMIANNIPGLVNLSSVPTGMVSIPNGWGTKRLRFLLEVEAYIGDMSEISYVQGFSEYHDPTLSGKIDDNMLFFINSITTVKKFINPVDNTVSIVPGKTFSVVNSIIGMPEIQEEYTPGGEEITMMRSQEILGDIQTMTRLAESNTSTASEDLTIISGAAIEGDTIDRKESDPSRYLSKTLNSYIDAMSESENSWDLKGIAGQAKLSTYNQNVSKNPFVFALHITTGDITVTQFKLSTLQKMSPNISSVTTMFEGGRTPIPNNGIGPSILDTSNVENNLQPSVSSILANTITHSMSSIMLDNLLMSFNVSFTNKTGTPVVTVMNADSIIEGIDPIPYANKAKIAIATTLIPEITKLNNRLVEIIVGCDIFTETTISISINMAPAKVYRFPTYADGLYQPTLANDAIKQTTVNNFHNMIDEIYHISATDNTLQPATRWD